MPPLSETDDVVWRNGVLVRSRRMASSRHGQGWKPIVTTLLALVLLGVIIVFLALVVAPSAGAAGGCGGG